MAINFAGYLFNDAGTIIQSATVKLLKVSDGATEASITTDGNGYWAFAEADQDTYDIEISNDTGSKRRIKWADQISLKEIDVRNNTAATTPAATFTNLTNNASNQVAVFRSDRGTGNATDGDEAYLSFYLRNSNNEEHEFARITAEAVDVTDGQEDGQLRFGIAKTNGNIVDVFTINSTTGGVTDMTLDVSGDLTLDADGGDIFFKDGGTTFGSATNSSGNLILKSGTTTAATFSGANVTFAGTVDATTDFTLGDTVITDGVITDTSGLSIVANTAVTGTLSASGLISANGGITFAAGDDIAFTGTTGTNDIVLTNGLADALSITDGSADVLVIDTSTSGNVITASSALTVGVDDTGHDVKFFGATAGSFLLWDESDDALELTDSSPIKIGDGGDMTIYHDGSNSYITNATGALKLATETDGIVVTIGHTNSEVTIADNLTVSGNLTVTGTQTIVDTVTMNAANAVVFEGATADGYETTLTIIDPTADRTVRMPNQSGYLPVLAAVSTTQISATPEELNVLDGVTAGTVTASLGVVVDSNKDIGSFRNITLTGELDAGSLDVSGNADIDGTLETDALTIGGTNIVTGSLITTLGTISAGTWNGTPVATAYIADNAITLDKLAGIAAGKIIYGDASGNPAVLTKATDGDVLTLASGLPSWATPTTGDITSIVAGDGLTGSSLTSGEATLTIVGGDGITANANDVAITPAQTTITSIYATDIVIGEDAQTQIDFETANEIHFDADNAEIAKVTTTGLTMSDDKTITLADEGQLIFSDDAPSTDDTATGEVWTMTALTGIAVGELVHIDVNGKLDEAHADATADMPAIGIALTANSSGSDAEINILTRGVYRDDGQFNFTPGLAVYVSAGTEGQFTQTAPSADGNFVQRVGIALTADTIWFNPSVDVIEHA